MNLETSIRKLIRNNDRRICDLATKLDNCDSDSEYEKLIEYYDLARGESRGLNRVLHLINGR